MSAGWCSSTTTRAGRRRVRAAEFVEHADVGVERQRHPEHVETGAEVGRRRRHPHHPATHRGICAASCDASTNRSSVAAAAPESIVAAASAIPSGEIGDPAAHHEPGARVEQHDVAVRPGVAAEHVADGFGVLRGHAADEVVVACPGEAEVVGVDQEVTHVAVVELDHLAAGRRASARRGRRRAPPMRAPTRACRASRPCAPRTPRSATPITWRRTRPGLAIGPSRLNTVGMPISRRDGPAKRNAGWNDVARQNPMPAVSTQCFTPSGCRSIATPSASSTSAVPHFDEAARAPCLHTATPAAGGDDRRHRRHVDRMRMVAAGADDVDDRCRVGPPRTARVDAAVSTASSRPDSSSTLSPFARRATTKRDQLGGRRVAGQDRRHRRARLVGGRGGDGRAAASAARASRRVRRSMDMPANLVPAADPSDQAVRRRWRSIRRRSRSVAPPHTPTFSRLANA